MPKFLEERIMEMSRIPSE